MMRGIRRIQMWSVVFLVGFLSSCSGDTGDSTSCPEGEIYDALRGVCVADVAAVEEGLKGTFSCAVVEDVSVTGTGSAEVVGLFQGEPLSFTGQTACYQAMEVSGLPILVIQMNTIQQDGEQRLGWSLTLTITQDDVDAGKLFSQTDRPYPGEAEPGKVQGILSRGMVLDTSGSLDTSGLVPVGRVNLGTLLLTSGDGDVGSMLGGDVDITSIKSFKADARNGDACTDNEDCSVGELQFCLFDDSEAPICGFAACEVDGDCAPSGGGACVGADADSFGICFAECNADGTCREGLACLQADEDSAVCAPPSLGDGGAPASCTTGDDCGGGDVCIAGLCAPPCNTSSDCGAQQTCGGGACLDLCDVVGQSCPQGQGCYVEPSIIPNGLCLPSAGVAVGDPCDQINACEVGAICIGESSTCHRVCDTMNPNCDSCTRLEGFDTTGVCLGPDPVPPATPCESAQTCGSGQTCDLGFCQNPCDPDNPTACGSDEVCIGTGEGRGECYPACNPDVPSTCPDPLACYLSSPSLCLPAGDNAAGAACDTINGCAPGLSCFSSVCKPVGCSADPQVCAAQDVCVQYTEGSICSPGCDLSSNACPDGQGCFAIGVGGELTCAFLAPDPSGVGDACVSSNQCEDGLLCFIEQCERMCDPERPVQCGDGEGCVDFELGYGLCAQECLLLEPACGPDKGCYPDGQGETRCFRSTENLSTGDTCMFSNDCAPGSFCYVESEDAESGVCADVCDPNQDTCAEGTCDSLVDYFDGYEGGACR